MTTTTTADPHLIATAPDAFSDAWAAVYIDVAEKLAADESEAQTVNTAITDANAKGDAACPSTSPAITTTET